MSKPSLAYPKGLHQDGDAPLDQDDIDMALGKKTMSIGADGIIEVPSTDPRVEPLRFSIHDMAQMMRTARRNVADLDAIQDGVLGAKEDAASAFVRADQIAGTLSRSNRELRAGVKEVKSKLNSKDRTVSVLSQSVAEVANVLERFDKKLDLLAEGYRALDDQILRLRIYCGAAIWAGLIAMAFGLWAVLK